MKNKENLHKTSTQGQSKPHLSVIIPTPNESAYLPQWLDALAIQARLPDEIIVADAGSGIDPGCSSLRKIHLSR